MKIDGHLGRCHFEGREGNAANVTLTAAGQSSARSRLRALLRPILLALWQVFAAIPAVSKETARWLQAGGQSPIGDIRQTTLPMTTRGGIPGQTISIALGSAHAATEPMI